MLSYIMLVLGLIISIIALYKGGVGDTVEAPKWKPITMVTLGIVAFALLLEPGNIVIMGVDIMPFTGMFPALVALVLLASLGGDEFKLWEVVANIVVLTIMCIVVFKVGLGMNISIIEGIW